ncbi:MAG: glycosyltransferase [Thermoanaerobaculia bacterium]
MANSSLYFCFPRSDVESMRRLDPDRDWRALQQGEEAWIPQGYLRLAALGAPVELVARPPDRGVVLFHAKHKRVLADQLIGLRHAIRVTIRGDLRGGPGVADFEIVQNPLHSDDRRRLFLPSWPQPGLIARDTGRGARLRTVAYKGYVENLHEEFRGESWRRALRQRGLEWECDAVAWNGGSNDRQALRWPDFSSVDAVLGVRPDGGARKPAAKLYNAWLAGVPAILGPEPAYRALRRSELDYIEVSTPVEALDALDRLQSSPMLYRAMIENGRQRAEEWTVDAVARKWRNLLEDVIPELAARDRRRRSGCAALARRLERRFEWARALLLPASRSRQTRRGLPAGSSP